MGVAALLSDLRREGLRVALSGGGLIVSPRSSITDSNRAAIRANRDAILSLLRREAGVTASLVASIDRCCDLRGDEDSNRAELISECCALPETEQEAWRDYFEDQSALWRRLIGAADGP